MRVWNKEIHVFDIYKQKWLTDFAQPSKENYIPKQRMYHASAIYGEWLVVHGGINTDDKSVYDDLFLFNIERKSWTGITETKQIISIVGGRYMHTLTTALPVNISDKERELLWQSTPSSTSAFLNFQYWGMYLFGGYKEGEGQMNDLWLIRPLFKAKQEGKSPVKKRPQTASYSLEAIKLEPEGKPPVSRVLHSTVFFKNRYLIIYGGKSEEIYASTKNLALNDVWIYDIPNNKWERLVMYGFHPNSRWSHWMTVVDKNQIVVFGGANLNNYYHEYPYKK